MSEKRGLREQFTKLDSDRFQSLETARLCAALTQPHVLPPRAQRKNQSLPENYQSLGSLGIENLEGRILTALYPYGLPWFRFQMPASIEHDPNSDPDMIRAVNYELFCKEVLVHSLLLSSNLKSSDYGNCPQASFHSHHRSTITDILVTGETLEHMDDDFRFRKFRRDQYVTLRDGCGGVLCHITRENVDPRTLTEEQRIMAKIESDDVDDEDDLLELYTKIEWQPGTKSWVICQEVRGVEINESEEKVSPYFCTPYKLVTGEHYGRGWVEFRKADLRSFDRLCKSRLEYAALCSKHIFVKDVASTYKDEDFAAPTGAVITGRVAGGQVQDAAMMKADKMSDYGVVENATNAIREQLASQMLLLSDVAPKGDRVTAFAWQQVVLEIEGKTGGIYAPIAESKQLPMLRRAVHVATKRNLMKSLHEKIEIKALTGIAALSQASRAQRSIEFVQAVNVLGQEAMAEINPAVLVEVLARYQGVKEPGLLRSPEDKQKVAQGQLAAQAAQAMIQKGVDVGGNIAQQQALPLSTITGATQ